MLDLTPSTPTDLFAVTIDRTTWGSGDKLIASLSTQSALYNPITKLQCCMGFACEAAGITKEQMSNVGYPHALLNGQAGNDPRVTVENFPPQLQKLVHLHHHESTVAAEVTSIAITLARMNDDPTLAPDVREAEIISLGIEAGIKFTFIGEA